MDEPMQVRKASRCTKGSDVDQFKSQVVSAPDRRGHHRKNGMSEGEGSVSHDWWLRQHRLHPGWHLYRGCVEAVEGVREGLGAGAAARKLGVSRATLSSVLNGRVPRLAWL